MALAGKNTLVKVSTVEAPTETDFEIVVDLNEASMSLEGDNMDVSTFGSDFIKRLQGLKDATYSLSGFHNPTDATGQGAIRDAWLNDTVLHAQFLPDGTTGFQQAVKVASIEVSGAVDGSIETSIELEGTDAITLV